LIDLDKWIEVKGYLPPRDKTKIKRFKKYYPEEFKQLEVIIRSPKVEAAEFFSEMGIPVYAYFMDIERECKDNVSNWNT
jgi:hypothetical protein